MKSKLYIYSILLIPILTFAQIGANQVDDFESSLENWTVGNPAVAANQISRPTDGGPAGAGDAYFSYVTTGNANGAGSRMIVMSRNAQWSGDFSNAGIVAVKMNVRATTGDLTLRIGLSDEATTSVGTQMVTTPIIIAAGSGWQSVTIPIQPSDFTVLDGGTGLTPAQVLASVSEMRILSNTTTNPLLFWLGETGARRMDLDNITAATTLSTNDITAITKEFLISPNPAKSRLNVFLPENSNNAMISVYNVLGKRVFTNHIDVLTTSIDVSKWNSGVYLVRISTENTMQTKRFVKQ